MITILEYANLAAHVYNPATIKLLNQKSDFLKTKNISGHHRSPYIPEGIYRLPDVHDELSYHGLADDLKEAFGYGFHAELYVKCEQGQAVDSAVAFCGTVTSLSIE